MLTTLAEVKKFLGRKTALSVDQEANLTQLVSQYSRSLEDTLGRFLEPKIVTNKTFYSNQFDPVDTMLFFKHRWRDVRSVSSIAWNDDVLTEGSEFYLDQDLGALVRLDGGSWLSSLILPDVYTISGIFGYVNNSADDTKELIGGVDAMTVGMSYKVTGVTFNSHAVGDTFVAVAGDNTAFTASTMKVIQVVKNEIQHICNVLVAVASGLWTKNWATTDGAQGTSTVTSVPTAITDRINQLRNFVNA